MNLVGGRSWQINIKNTTTHSLFPSNKLNSSYCHWLTVFILCSIVECWFNFLTSSCHIKRICGIKLKVNRYDHFRLYSALWIMLLCMNNYFLNFKFYDCSLDYNYRHAIISGPLYSPPPSPENVYVNWKETNTTRHSKSEHRQQQIYKKTNK